MRSVASDIFYVYVDYRLDTNVPFYVGKGQDVRVKLVRRNIIHQRIAKKAGMRREVLFGTKDQHFALDEEVRLIRELKTRNQFGGANLTDGGEGTTGWVPSEETKRKIAIAHQGLAHTSETKARISQATSGENNPITATESIDLPPNVPSATQSSTNDCRAARNAVPVNVALRD